MAAPPPPPALWAPQQEGVNQILQLLTEYMQPGANQQQVRNFFRCMPRQPPFLGTDTIAACGPRPSSSPSPTLLFLAVSGVCCRVKENFLLFFLSLDHSLHERACANESPPPFRLSRDSLLLRLT